MKLTTWEKRIEEAYQLMSPCRLCPRSCKVQRLEGKKGFCGIAARAVVSSYGPHFGEESYFTILILYSKSLLPKIT